MTQQSPIRVLIVDDSALVRQLLTAIFKEDPTIEVVGTANDPYVARDKIKRLNPDVLTLDIEMPRMDGLTFLRNLMRLRPMPVVMISSLTEQGADKTMEALAIGAVDFVAKPKADVAEQLTGYAEEIIAKVKAAAQSRPSSPHADRPQGAAGEPAQVPVRPARPGAGRPHPASCQLIAIGASTGGTEAIGEVLQGLPAELPGIVIAQHIPKGFSAAFARRIDKLSEFTVHEAQDGDVISNGHAFIAPGGQHLEVVRRGTQLVCRVYSGEPVNRHQPSVDVLFHTVAKLVGGKAIGVILTGMGADGVEGLAAMHAAGARTLAQDEASSVVWGMPGVAVKRGIADATLTLRDIPANLARLASHAPGAR